MLIILADKNFTGHKMISVNTIGAFVEADGIDPRFVLKMYNTYFTQHYTWPVWTRSRIYCLIYMLAIKENVYLRLNLLRTDK